jgi:Tfp pilus assembly protein PilF
MQSLPMRLILLVQMTIVAVGCSRGSQHDGSQFQHDSAAKLFLEAMQVRETDRGKALELLTQSIEARPAYHAYYHRAWIHALQGQDGEAVADVKAGLELEPESADLHWLEGELKKPANQRKLDKPPARVK